MICAYDVIRVTKNCRLYKLVKYMVDLIMKYYLNSVQISCHPCVNQKKTGSQKSATRLYCSLELLCKFNVSAKF